LKEQIIINFNYLKTNPMDINILN